MTVAELIEILVTKDPDAVVLMQGSMHREMERKASVMDVVEGMDMDNPNSIMLSPRRGG